MLHRVLAGLDVVWSCGRLAPVQSGIWAVEATRKPRRFLCGLVVQQASLLTSFNRLAVALAKSQDHRASCGVFAFGPDRQGALADGLHGLNPRNTDNKRHPLVCRPALIERLVKDWVQRWKQGPIYKRINPSSALGLFCFCRCFEINGDKHEDGERWYIHPWRTYA